VLGALFRSARWRRAETELVIIVTPRLVQPTTDAGGGARNPLAPATEAGDAGLFLGGRALDRPIERPVGGTR
jgi:pilus assembly protein CpaC